MPLRGYGAIARGNRNHETRAGTWPRQGPAPATGVMAARRVEDVKETRMEIRQREAATAYWSRCEAALAGSRITVAASDRDGRYTWIFNAPGGVARAISSASSTAKRFRPTPRQRLPAPRRRCSQAASRSEIELELGGERGPRWFDVTRASALRARPDDRHRRLVHRRHRPQGAGGAPPHRAAGARAPLQESACGDPGDRAADGGERRRRRQRFVSRFNGRIFSLSRAHDVLTDADWRGARIFDLVRSQIALYAENRWRR